MELLIASHAINIVFVGSISILLLSAHPTMEKNFGWDSPARQMFASVYLTITLTSLFALLFRSFMEDISFVLFPLQILHVFLCLITVQSKRNWILWMNILFALFQILALVSIFRPFF